MGRFFPCSKFTAAQTDTGTRVIPAGKWQCYESTRDVIVATRLPAPPSLLFPQLALIRRSAFTVQLHCVHLRLIAFCCARTGCTLKRFPFSSEDEREREIACAGSRQKKTWPVSAAKRSLLSVGAFCVLGSAPRSCRDATAGLLRCSGTN